jgi:hypothetical protein
MSSLTLVVLLFIAYMAGIGTAVLFEFWRTKDR